jgi:hypothetical protein
MKSLILIVAATFSLAAQASETCMLEARTWTPRATKFKFFPSDADSQYFLSASCQIDSEGINVRSVAKEDLGGSPMMGLINMYRNQGFQIVSCSKQASKSTAGRGLTETCYAVK